MTPGIIPIRWYPKLPDAARVEIPEWRFRDYPGIEGFVIAREITSDYLLTKVEGITYMLFVADRNGNPLDDVDQPRATLEQSVLVARNSYHIPPAEWVEIGRSRFEPFLEAAVSFGSHFGYDHLFVANDLEAWEEMFGRSMSHVRIELARLKHHPNPYAVCLRTFDAHGYEGIAWDCPTLDHAYAYALEHFKVSQEDWKPIPPKASGDVTETIPQAVITWERTARSEPDRVNQTSMNPGIIPIRRYSGVPDAARPQLPEWRLKDYQNIGGFLIARNMESVNYATVRRIFYMIYVADKDGNPLEVVYTGFDTLEQAMVIAQRSFFVPPSEWVEIGSSLFKPTAEAPLAPGSQSGFSDHLDGFIGNAKDWEELLGRSLNPVRVQLARLTNHPNPNGVCIRTFDAQGHEGAARDCATLAQAYAHVRTHLHVDPKDWKRLPTDTVWSELKRIFRTLFQSPPE